MRHHLVGNAILLLTAACTPVPPPAGAVATRDASTTDAEQPDGSPHDEDAATTRDQSSFDDSGGADVGPVSEMLRFQDGVAPTPAYSGTRDTVMKESDPDTSFGSVSPLEADGNDGRDVLFKWDVSAVPGGATVSAASLRFVATDDGGDYGVYGVDVPWREDEATWEERGTDLPWTEPGCRSDADRTPQSFGTVRSDGSDEIVEIPSSPEFVARVQSWVADSTTNHGIVVQNPDATAGVRLRSREADDPPARPRLTIEFTR